MSPNNIKEMSERLGSVRGDFLSRVEKAVGETTIFALAVSNAIGEISLDEAERGIVEFFTEQMRKK